MLFTRPLSSPLTLSDGRVLSTLADVVDLMQTLPALHLRNEHWDIAAKAIQDAAEGGDIDKAERVIRVALWWERLLRD